MKTKHLFATVGVTLIGTVILAASSFAATNTKQAKSSQVQESNIQSELNADSNLQRTNVICKDEKISYTDENGVLQEIELGDPIDVKDGIKTYQYKDDQGNDIMIKMNDDVENNPNISSITEHTSVNFICEDEKISYTDENGVLQEIELGDPIDVKDGIETYQYKDAQGNNIVIKMNDETIK